MGGHHQRTASDGGCGAGSARSLPFGQRPDRSGTARGGVETLFHIRVRSLRGRHSLSSMRPPPAWSALLGVVALDLALHAVSAAVIGYGYNADELYFLDCAN